MKKYFIVILLTIVFLISTFIPSNVFANEVTDASIIVEQGAIYLESSFPNASDEWCIAVSAAYYVNSHIDPRMYGYYTSQGITINTPELSLQYGAGLCGSQTWVFMSIMQEFNIPVRTVQLWNINGYNTENHIFAEAYYGNKWNAFDLTAGCYFYNGAIWETLSFAEIQSLPNYMDNIRVNQLSPIYLGYTGLLDYIDVDNLNIVYGGVGTIELNNNNGIVSLVNVTNALGHYDEPMNNTVSDIKFHINNLDNEFLNITCVAGGSGTLYVSDGNISVSTPLSDSMSIDISSLNQENGITLSINPIDIYGYAIISSITLSGSYNPPEYFTVSASKDGAMVSGAPTTNYGISNLWVRGNLTNGSYRSIISFNPDWATIGGVSQAILSLYYAYYTEINPNGMGVQVYSTRHDWVENQFTWNIYQTGNNWATAGGDLYGTPVISYIPSSTGVWVTWDITSIVQEAYYGNTSVDLILKSLTETGSSAINAVFNASNVSDPNIRPKLIITN